MKKGKVWRVNHIFTRLNVEPSLLFSFLSFCLKSTYSIKCFLTFIHPVCVCVCFLYLNIKIESKAIYMPAHTQYTWLSGSVLIWSTITTHTFNKIKYVTFDINKKKCAWIKFVCVFKWMRVWEIPFHVPPLIKKVYIFLWKIKINSIMFTQFMCK